MCAPLWPARNLYSVSFNFAASEGNQQLLHALNAHTAARAANCSAETRDYDDFLAGYTDVKPDDAPVDDAPLDAVSA